MEIGNTGNGAAFQQHVVSDYKEQSFIDNNSRRGNTADRKLKEVVDEFSAIFLQQVFKSMRKTLPDNSLLDGGFAEDVYTGMLDREISKLGASQQKFSSLNETLYRQLSEKIERGRLGEKR